MNYPDSREKCSRKKVKIFNLSFKKICDKFFEKLIEKFQKFCRNFVKIEQNCKQIIAIANRYLTAIHVLVISKTFSYSKSAISVPLQSA